MERYTEQQREARQATRQAAHQAIAGITADLGPRFVLETVADALEQAARTETGSRGDNLGHAAGIVRQLANVLNEKGEHDE